MTYTISEDGTKLTLECCEIDRAILRTVKEEEPERWGTRDCEQDFCEGLVCNSELDWGWPEECDDLTDAPMFRILEGGDEQTAPLAELRKDRLGEVNVGGDERGGLYQAVMGRWAYMHYMLRSFLEDLLETGKATFEGHYIR
jgi:hypothetical protein